MDDFTYYAVQRSDANLFLLRKWRKIIKLEYIWGVAKAETIAKFETPEDCLATMNDVADAHDTLGCPTPIMNIIEITERKVLLTGIQAK
jgi:hypothetical protein